MTPTDLAGLCERLREQKIIDAFSTPLGPVKKMPTNPDGPEAAAAIERLVAALERIRSEADTTRFIEVPRRNLDRCADIAHETLDALQQAGEVG